MNSIAPAALTAQFGASMLGALTTWLQAAANNGAEAIGEVMNERIELKQQTALRQVLALLSGI